VNIFDDLGDPLGPPEGDALGAVLARARRKRVVRRGTVAVLAVVGVAAFAVSANAFTAKSGHVHVEGPRTTVSPSVTSTSTASTTTTATSTTTSGVTTTSTSPSSGAEPWSGQQLTITPQSLGGVRVGMTLDEAQQAAGYAFDGTGDGAYYSTTVPAGFPHLFVRLDQRGDVSCVGAEISDQASIPQAISTPEGFRLGETVPRLQAVYGARARFVPAPAGGISPRAGYVVTEAGGALAFYVDNTNTRILGIKGGGTDLTPSSCSG